MKLHLPILRMFQTAGVLVLLTIPGMVESASGQCSTGEYFESRSAQQWRPKVGFEGVGQPEEGCYTWHLRATSGGEARNEQYYCYQYDSWTGSGNFVTINYSIKDLGYQHTWDPYTLSDNRKDNCSITGGEYESIGPYETYRTHLPGSFSYTSENQYINEDITIITSTSSGTKNPDGSWVVLKDGAYITKSPYELGLAHWQPYDFYPNSTEYSIYDCFGRLSREFSTVDYTRPPDPDLVETFKGTLCYSYLVLDKPYSDEALKSHVIDMMPGYPTEWPNSGKNCGQAIYQIGPNHSSITCGKFEYRVRIPNSQKDVAYKATWYEETYGVDSSGKEFLKSKVPKKERIYGTGDPNNPATGESHPVEVPPDPGRIQETDLRVSEL